MKLHHLRIEAFGPFPGVEEIDFDELGAHGIHLIHGPTGAGKTTVLDAICFALFGQVPGSRRGQRESLRSDHAAASAVPRVVLELTVGGRRLRLDRSPEHRVAKKRGAGMTRRQSKVVMTERVKGQWSGVSIRLDEVGDVINQALGMGLDQFAQVVLLPQGEFAAFLQARPDDRGHVLRQLFDVERFVDLEDWLVLQRRAAAAAAADARAQVSTSLVRVESVLSDLPADDEEATAWTELPLGAVTQALASEQTRLSGAADRRMADAARADLLLEQARDAVVHARAQRALRAEAQIARSDLQRLSDDETAAAEARAELELARRAGLVHASSQTASRAHSEHAVAVDELHAARHEFDRVTTAFARSGGSSVGDRGRVEDELAMALTAGEKALSAAAHVYGDLAVAADAMAESAQLVAGGQQRVDDEARRLGGLHGRVEQLVTEAASVLEASQQHPAAVRARDLLRRVGIAQTAVETAEAAQQLAVATAEQTTRDFHSAESAVLRLRAARLDNLAGALAHELVDGQPCPVCGSAEHPAAAITEGEPISQERIDQAEAAAQRAAERHRADAAALAVARMKVTDARDALSRSLSEASLDAHAPHDVAELVEAAEHAVSTAAAAGRRHERLEVELAEIRGRLTSGQNELDRRSREQTVRTARLLASQQRVSASGAALLAAVADHDQMCQCSVATSVEEASRQSLQADLDDLVLPVSLETQEPPAGWADGLDAAGRVALTIQDYARVLHESIHGRHDGVEEALRDVQQTRARARVAAQASGRASADLAQLLSEHEFEDAAAAQSAWRPADRTREIERLLQERAARDARAMAVLERPDVMAAVEQPEADLAQLQDVADAAAATSRAAQAAMTTTQRALSQLRTIGRDLHAAVEQLTPHDERLQTLTALADAVSGAGDNVKKMRLSSYVLASRLEEVTRLANERLTVMSDGRFTLAHSDARAKGGLRSGLGLVVHDAWTGQTRDTATLSGGETFLASLALALGLGDAVREDAGGLELQTLFVDEGFGLLDEQSLEQVMSVLDDLRAGGRSIGIVSHVGELKHRIPAQVEVRMTESGSTVIVRTPGSSAA